MTRSQAAGWMWAGAVLALAASAAFAQAPTATAPEKASSGTEDAQLESAPQDEVPRPRGGPPGPGGRLGDRFGWGVQLFQGSPADRGPLRPGEEEALLAFAQERLPRLYELLNRIRQRNPERFRFALEEHAPRLRHLQRIYQRSPRLGDLVRQHAQNMLELQRLLKELRRAGADPHTAAERQDLRVLMLENVVLEADALDVLADELETQRETRIAERVAELLEDDRDPTECPEPLQNVLAEYRATTDAAERELLQARVRTMVGRHFAMEIERLRERAARIRAEQEGEADRQLERLLKGGGRRFGPHGAGMHGAGPPRGGPPGEGARGAGGPPRP